MGNILAVPQKQELGDDDTFLLPYLLLSLSLKATDCATQRNIGAIRKNSGFLECVSRQLISKLNLFSCLVS